MQQEGKTGAGKSRSRLVYILIISFVLAMALIFSLPIIQIPVQVTETYFETEYKEEPYTEIETYTVKTTAGSTDGNSQTLFDDALINLGASVMPDRWGTEVPFELDVEGKSNVFVSGNWEVENFSHAIYATITDPMSNIVYQHRGAEASSQADSFYFDPKIAGTIANAQIAQPILQSTHIDPKRAGKFAKSWVSHSKQQSTHIDPKRAGAIAKTQESLLKLQSTRIDPKRAGKFAKAQVSHSRQQSTHIDPKRAGKFAKSPGTQPIL